MLEIQKYLQTHSLEQLKDDYGINYKINEDGRVLCDYDQIESSHHKSHQIVRDARGLVLENNTWKLISKSFSRFFNYPEVDIIDWSNPVNCTVKEDGSLINLHHYNGNWHATTRYSWCDLFVNDHTETWKQLIDKHIDYSKLDIRFSYIFELVGPYNKVVVDYPPGLILLSVFLGEYESSYEDAKEVAKYIGIPHVKSFNVKSEDELFTLLNGLNKNCVDSEGFVIRDCNNVRSKVKHELYMVYHRFIMANELDELLSFKCFQYLKEDIKGYQAKIDKAWQEIDNVWFCHHDEPSQRRFAEKIIKDTKYTAPLFNARKTGKSPREFFTSDYVLKNVFGVKP